MLSKRGENYLSIQQNLPVNNILLLLFKSSAVVYRGYKMWPIKAQILFVFCAMLDFIYGSPVNSALSRFKIQEPYTNLSGYGYVDS